ncbi:hypothetical protein Tco_1049692 [Tanacetum coccineum]
MEEYIRLEEEKAQRHGRTFNWQTASFGKVKYCEDEDDCFTNFETEFPAIVFDDTLTSDATLSCEPTVSPLNKNEINFRISFDEFDDEDYMVIFDNNSFSYKIISVDNLKTDSKNDNDKVNMPSFPSPEPTVNYSDDLDYFKDFETEFLAIVYNDGLTSNLDFLTEPIVSPQHIDEFNLKNDTSLSKHDEEEQNVLYFNDLIPFNIIYPDDPKSDKDNDDDEIDIIQSLGGGQCMTPLPPRDQRHPWLRYQVEGYTEDIMHNFEQRLVTIFGRSVNRVHVLDFAGLTEEMRQTLADRLRMVCTGDKGHDLFTNHTWRRLFEIRGPLLGGARRRMTWRQFILVLGLHTTEEMAKDRFEAYWLGSARVIPNKGDLRDYWIEISSDKDFLGPSPSYVYIKDAVRRLCHRMISCNISGRGQAPEKVTGIDLFYLRNMDHVPKNVPYLLEQYYFRYAKERKSGSRLSEGHFIGRLAAHFGLISGEGLRGLSAWVSPGPERHPAIAAGALKDVEGAHDEVEGGQAVLAPVQAPQPPPPTLVRTIA